MRQSVIARAIPISLAIVGIILLYVWLGADAAVDLTERIPTAQDQTQTPEDSDGVVKIKGTLAVSS